MPRYFQPNRRDFLRGSAGASLVAIAQLAAPAVFAAQNQSVNEFNNLRDYGVKLYNETDAHNDAEHLRVRGTGQNPDLKFPYLFNGKMSGRKVTVLIPPKLPSESYSLETKVYFAEAGAPSTDEWAKLRKVSPSSIFFDSGFKGNLLGRKDIVTDFTVNSESMEYCVFMGDGGYYLAHFAAPKREKDIEIRIKIIFDGLAKLRLSERDNGILLGALTSLDGPNDAFGHSPNVMLILLDGVAWHMPSGAMQSYWDLSLNNKGMKANVGKQPRLIGSYSGTSDAELQRRREQAIANGDKQNRQIIQTTIDNLVAEGKISLQ